MYTPLCVHVCVFISRSVLIPPAHYTLIHSRSPRRSCTCASSPPFPISHTYARTVHSVHTPCWSRRRGIHTLDTFHPRGAVASVGEPMSAGMVVGATGQVSDNWQAASLPPPSETTFLDLFWTLDTSQNCSANLFTVFSRAFVVSQ